MMDYRTYVSLHHTNEPRVVAVLVCGARLKADVNKNQCATKIKITLLIT